MIGALWAILSLNLSAKLVQNYGIVAATLAITGATPSTPIVVECPAHGVAPGRWLDGIVSGVTGTTEANGLWRMTPTDADHLALATFDPQGTPVDSVGAHAYVSGGQIQYALPDGGILLGRQMLGLASAVASPRVVVIPTDGAAWIYESQGSVGITAQAQRTRGSTEQQAMRTAKLYATELSTFEVSVTGAASPPSPNFGDFDATQLVVWVLYQTLFEGCTDDIAHVLHESWPSQREGSGVNLQRGQMWRGIVQIKQPVSAYPAQFVPRGTSLTVTVEPVNPGPTDPITITVPGV